MTQHLVCGILRCMTSLPPGLDPVTAGRLGLWLLGKRNHNKALKRTAYPFRVHAFSASISQRFVRLICPWEIHEYPGWIRQFATDMGVAVSTAKTWLYQPEKMSRRGKERLLALSQERLRQWQELVQDLERAVAEKSAPKASKRRGGKTG